MRALSKSSETQTLKISMYPKNIVLREIFCLAIVFFYQITVCIMKYGVIWKSCQYLYGLVIIKLLLLWRAVLIMWTTHISKWQPALQRKKLIKIIQVENITKKKLMKLKAALRSAGNLINDINICP